MNITEAPAVVTVGRFTGGNRSNIVPDEVELEGTIRAFDESVRKTSTIAFATIATHIAESGRRARRPWTIGRGAAIPVTRQRSGVDRADAADARDAWRAPTTCELGPLVGAAEDFSFFQQKVPGLFFFLGVTPRDQDSTTAATESLAAVLRRRSGAADRRQGDDEPRPRLPVRRQVMPQGHDDHRAQERWCDLRKSRLFVFGNPTAPPVVVLQLANQAFPFPGGARREHPRASSSCDDSRSRRRDQVVANSVPNTQLSSSVRNIPFLPDMNASSG